MSLPNIYLGSIHGNPPLPTYKYGSGVVTGQKVAGERSPDIRSPDIRSPNIKVVIPQGRRTLRSCNKKITHQYDRQKQKTLIYKHINTLL
uniref:Uncharacterized protein n=1 Tax=Romanomermis culicivorax TaxID=13658 RepID=A0A915JII4_ROMCU